MLNDIGSGGLAQSVAEAPRRLVLGIGQLVVSNTPGDVIVTHALGSCVAVCIFDPVAHVAGMLHSLLPESKINPDRARQQPAAFADTGIPLLFREAYAMGLNKRRATVTLVGGADTAEHTESIFRTGRRNVLAAKQILWRNNVLVNTEHCGGTQPRTVHLAVEDGQLRIFSGGEVVKET